MANAATLNSSTPQTAVAESTPAKGRFHAFAMLSHCGRVRQANEDACAALPDLGAFVVCDGMGGAAAGEVASQLATETFLHSLSQPAKDQPVECPPDPDRLHTRLHQAVCAANQAVYRHSRKSPSLNGMGTTLVAALLDDAASTLWLAHVGDSRAYRLRSGALEQLTRDHSLVEEQIAAGLLSRDEADASPIRNIITRAVGSQATVEPEIASHATQPGDFYLLASDGLTRELDDAEIATLITAGATLESACQILIDTANHNGGHDNITVLLISC